MCIIYVGEKCMLILGMGVFVFLCKENIVVLDGYNCWWVLLVFIVIYFCIGFVYVWLVFNMLLIWDLGVVVFFVNDWSLFLVVWIFLVVIVCFGLVVVFVGKWLEKVGFCFVGVVVVFLWGGGFIVGLIGIFIY